MVTEIRRATADDAGVLARVAAVTFPLACPPSTTEEAKADFIDLDRPDPEVRSGARTLSGDGARPARERVQRGVGSRELAGRGIDPGVRPWGQTPRSDPGHGRSGRSLCSRPRGVGDYPPIR